MKPLRVRAGAAAALGLSALLLAGCQAASPPPPPPAPAPAPPPPPTTLSADVVHVAAAYQGYVRQATALTPGFTDPTQVRTELQASAAYEPRQLSRGVIAYGAILALQDPAFVAGVKQFSRDPGQRSEVASRIFADPAYAAVFPGADSAAGLIVAKLSADGAAMNRTGAAIKQAAYEIQHQPWSKQIIADREGRLAATKQISGVVMTGSSEDNAHLMQAALNGQGLEVTPGVAKPPYTEGVVRSLAIAALAVLGAAGEDHNAQISNLLDDQGDASCLSLSKLNLYQCLAVAKPHYEDVFCLGQHGLMDTGRCVQKVAGTAPVEMLEVDRRALAQAAAAQSTAGSGGAGHGRAAARKKHK